MVVSTLLEIFPNKMASIAKDALAASLQDLYNSKDDDPLTEADFKVVTANDDEIMVHSLLMVCR